jgi:hypothetical protein
MDENIDDILLNVRRAYRLLNAYHRRVLDTVKAIGQRLDGVFYYWTADEYWKVLVWNEAVFAKYWGAIATQKVRFYFISDESFPKAGQWLLEVAHLGDTADDGVPASYDPTVLTPAEGSMTAIRLTVAVATFGESASWDVFWAKCKYPWDAENARKIGGWSVWEGTAAGCLAKVASQTWSVSEFGDDHLIEARCQDLLDVITTLSVRPGTLRVARIG